jgi:hypothetical protein
MRKIVYLLLFLVPFFSNCWAQADGAQQQTSTPELAAQPKNEAAVPEKPKFDARLKVVEALTSKTELALGFSDLQCDEDGNIYLGVEYGGGSTSIRKMNSAGELVARFEPYGVSEVQVLGAGSYAISSDGNLYTWVGNQKDGFFYILAFASDGHFKSKTKLDPGVPWIPASLAAFQNGNFLMTGQVGDGNPRSPMVPFTAIFRADGKLLKQISLEDDGEIYDLTKARDPKLTSVAVPASNRAVAWGRAEAAKDGNVYVMRWMSPALIYAISGGGAVVRKFSVDPGDKALMPVMMHVSGGRIAVLFRNEATREQSVKVVNLEGEEIANYDASPHDEKMAIGAAFACYFAKQTRFIFLASDDDRRIMLRAFEPK